MDKEKLGYIAVVLNEELDGVYLVGNDIGDIRISYSTGVFQVLSASDTRDTLSVKKTRLAVCVERMTQAMLLLEELATEKENQ